MEGGLIVLIVLLTLLLVFLPFYIVYSILFQSRWFMYLLHKISPKTLFYFKTTERKVVLTIDDGPSGNTPQILDLLKQYNAHATFFIIGSKVKGRETTMKRIVDEGHDIGNHTWTDEPSFKNTPEEFEEKITKTDNALQPFMKNQQFKWFRPGSGIPMSFMVEPLEKLGYQMTVGSLHAFDAQIKNCSYTSFILNHGIVFGDICIVHDRSYTLPEIESFLKHCVKYEIQVVSLSEMMSAQLQSQSKNQYVQMK